MIKFYFYIMLFTVATFGGLFADDIVLLAPTKSSLKNLLNIAHDWGIKNEMTFGINNALH